MARRKHKRSKVEEVMTMWDGVRHLAEIELVKLQALEELRSDDEFLAKLSAAEAFLERMRDVLDCPRDL